MENFRVNQKTKVVTVYSKSIDKFEFEKVERYKKLGYEITMLEKKTPVRKNKGVKEDMEKYLKGNIDNDLYAEFIDRVEKKQNFLKLKWWLIKELKERANKQGKEFEPIEDIINRAKSREEKANGKKEEEKKKNKDVLNANK